MSTQEFPQPTRARARSGGEGGVPPRGAPAGEGVKRGPGGGVGSRRPHRRRGSEDRPSLDLLVFKELVRPIDDALAVLRDIRDEMDPPSSQSVALAGLCAFAVSQLEVALADTIRYILIRNPWRMEFLQFEVKRDKALSSELVRELLTSHAEGLVRGWTYGRKADLFRRFLQVADLPKTLTRLAPKVTHLFEERNRILHRAPPQSEWVDSPKIWISHTDAQQCAQIAAGVLGDLRAALADKYGSHGRVAALRRLWSYLFTSPVMKFDRYWEVDEASDRVEAIKDDAPVERLSRSERILLGFWQAEFGGDASLLREFSMKHLDARRRRDVVTLIAALRDLWLD